MTQAFNISILLRADSASAKAGLAEVTTALKHLSTESEKASGKSRMQAAEMERLAKATAIAATSQNELANAEHRAAEARQRIAATPLNVLSNPAGNQVSLMDSVVANMTTGAARASVAWRGAETSIVSVQQATMGLNASIGTQAHEMVEAAQASALYQRQLDEIRASYNPLYAASRQYEQQLEKIAAAERLGAISAREAAAARAAAAQIIAPAGAGPAAGSNISSAYTANVAAQGFDIGVTAAMGMNPMMIGLQQGTQLVQVMQQMGGGTTALKGLATGFLSILNPMSLATIGFVAFGAAAMQGIAGLMPKTKSLQETLETLADGVTRVRDANNAARRSILDLGKDFGSTSEEAKKLLELMAELERRTQTRNVSDTLTGIYSELDGGGLMGMRSRSDRFGSLQRMFGEANWLTSGRVNQEASPLSYSVMTAMNGLETARQTNDLDQQIEAIGRLKDSVRVASEAFGGLTKEEEKWLQQLTEAQLELQKLKATDENAAGKAAAEAMARSYREQLDIERASLVFGQDSAEVAAVRNSQEAEALRQKLESLGLSQDQKEYQHAMNGLLNLQLQAERAIQAEKMEQARARQDAIEALRREQRLLEATTAEQIRAKAIAEADITIRKEKLDFLDAILLKTDAIAKAEAEIALNSARATRELQTTAMMDQYDLRAGLARDPRVRADIEAEREMTRQLRDGADPAHARASADRVRAAALNDLTLAQDRYLQDQQHSMQQMQLELALLGQSEEVRRRVLALAEAERQISETGASGEVAERIREGARAQADTALALEAQASAWQRVQAAGEGAIDSVLDKLKEGDVKGALADFIGEIEKGFFDLAIRNPLKNAIFGSNLGTWDDVGGWSGVWGRLTGKNKVDEAGLARTAAMTTPSMMVTAANVTLSGNIAGLGNLTGASNLNAAPMPGFSAGNLTGSKDVQSQVWAFFAQKGLKPHQIAGIMGNISQESGFDPLAKGDAGQAFGLFQHNDRKGNLFDFIGGKQNLGSVQKQLEFAWQEMMTTEFASYSRLMASTDVKGATDAFLGFERPSGFSVANPAGAHGYGNRQGAAQAAYEQFGAATQQAAVQIGQLGADASQAGNGMTNLGQGMGKLGGGIGQMLSGIAGSIGGEKGGLLQTLLGIGGQIADGVPLFNTGGFTGGSDPARAAGIVHEGEYVFDAAATRRIGVANLEGIRKGGMRGFRDGGFVGVSPSTAQNTNAPVSLGAREPDQLNFNIDLTGARGDKEIMEGVRSTVRAAFEEYRGRGMAADVKAVMRDMRAS